MIFYSAVFNCDILLVRGGVGNHGHICSKQENVPKQPNKSRLKSLKEGVQLAAKTSENWT